MESSLLEHGIITTALAVLHLALFYFRARNLKHESQATQRWLWRRFVVLLFVVYAMFANAVLVLPSNTHRIAAMIAIVFNTVILLDYWRRKTKAVQQREARFRNPHGSINCPPQQLRRPNCLSFNDEKLQDGVVYNVRQKSCQRREE